MPCEDYPIKLPPRIKERVLAKTKNKTSGETVDAAI